MADAARLDNTGGTLTALPDLAYPNGYEEYVSYRAVDTELADGTVSTDMIQSGAKRRFVLRWRNLDTSDKNDVNTAFGAVKDGTARTFEPPFTTTTYEVTRDVGFYEIEWRASFAQSGLRWSGEMRLREV